MNQDQIKQLNEAVEAVKTRKIENVYFVACGVLLAALVFLLACALWVNHRRKKRRLQGDLRPRSVHL